MKRGPCETHSINGVCADCGMTNGREFRRSTPLADLVAAVEPVLKMFKRGGPLLTEAQLTAAWAAFDAARREVAK